MIRLSVNVNKVATLRNARAGRVPSVVDAVEACIAAGAPGITVHPRADRRHIGPDDVREIARTLSGVAPRVEYNIEGDPRPELLDLVDEVRPDQCTLVPVLPGEITSQAGWQPGPYTERMPEIVRRLHGLGVRVSLFVDARADPIRTRARSNAGTSSRGARWRRTPTPRGSRTRSALASTPATISTSPTSWCSAICRSSTRCPSGTPSSRARCLSVSRRSCASILRCSRLERYYDQLSALS
jgi:hypothetical protein